MTSSTRSAWRILGDFEKNQFVELRTGHRTRRVDFRGSLRPDEFARYGRRTRWGADEKARIERMCISIPYVETFNSKVIRGFVPELRSRYVFFEFRDSYVLCIYVTNIMNVLRTGMNMSISRIHIWLLYIKTLKKKIQKKI